MKPISEFVKPDPLPKYFGIDVDGTFYTSKTDVFNKNAKAFKLLKDKNITPFFCTGKDPKSAKNIISDDFKITTGYNGFPGVYTNGSIVYDSNGNLIKIEKLPGSFLKKFFEYANTNNINDKTIYITDQGVYILDDLSTHCKNYLSSLKYVVPLKISHKELIQKNVVAVIISQFITLNFNGIHFHTYCLNGKFEISHITPNNCNKKTGVEAFLNHLNSNPDECVYIGDGENDREAMEFCTTSFAVGNADDTTKQKAKWVIDIKHDEGAFEKAVHSLLNLQDIPVNIS